MKYTLITDDLDDSKLNLIVHWSNEDVEHFAPESLDDAMEIIRDIQIAIELDKED